MYRIRELPTEISLHILSFIRDPQTLSRAGTVSKFWRFLLCDEYMWKTMCKMHRFCSDMPSTGLCSSPRSRNINRLGVLDAECSGADDYDQGSSSSSLTTFIECGSDGDANSNSRDVDMLDLATLEIENFVSSSPLHTTASRPLSSRTTIIGSVPTARRRPTVAPSHSPFSYRQHFKSSYVTGPFHHSVYPPTP